MRTRGAWPGLGLKSQSLSLPGLTGQSSNPCAGDMTVGRNRFITPLGLGNGAMRFAYCALHAADVALTGRPESPVAGDDSVCRSCTNVRHRPLFASDVTQPCMRDFTFSMSFLVKKSSGLTLSTG